MKHSLVRFLVGLLIACLANSFGMWLVSGALPIVAYTVGVVLGAAALVALYILPGAIADRLFADPPTPQEQAASQIRKLRLIRPDGTVVLDVKFYADTGEVIDDAEGEGCGSACRCPDYEAEECPATLPTGEAPPEQKNG